MAKTIMLQGTSSHVGKSILTTALCRIFLQDDFKVVPFKAQNMALNSYVTREGGEMGRAQVAQAEAAGLEPAVEMNPVLLKPTGNSCSQVILKGTPVGNMSAAEYHNGYSLKALQAVKECLHTLSNAYDIMVIEGAGSPAEVNLKAQDIVNMRVAKLAQAPVLLVADIDRGGALAAVVGTLELLEADERELVKGIIINKFRGDIGLLQPALEFLEKKTGKPVLGVIPHIEQLGIDDEDSVSLDEKVVAEKRELEIAVLRTPKISNFTDFDALAGEPDVAVRYVKRGEKIGCPDLIILPGSKNTQEDLLYLREQGYEEEIVRLVSRGTPLIGICGGYQMLGMEIRDPDHTESRLENQKGLGLLNIITTFLPDKVTHQITASCNGQGFLGIDYTDHALTGYEIHMGRTEPQETYCHTFTITSRSGQDTECYDGIVRQDGLVMGTYIHGIFDNDGYRQSILDKLRERNGLPSIVRKHNTRAEKQASYNRLADIVRRHLDMKAVYRLMNLRSC
ncbi:Cobyric acid synthase [Propionispora sp. 2/2-37]|uniref:cobyric acid synthase n=1 Tax=Propionispora sp. 2/2-37 TaxID=1677858 RepID=UPI0006BB8B19|nr:cobyric acid synthase [Propionispora sp. 2/2-37]CUH94015.1 Cobyric acid synthase [Propionispora sp. 2/2-37]